MVKVRIAATTAVLLAVTACSSEASAPSPDEPQVQDTPDFPACAEVWQPEQTLPVDYEGCMKGDTIEAGVSIECTDGSLLFTYEDQMWAIGGGEIIDQGYERFYNECVA